MKRIVSVQDISCIGKCSQTVALPIISACKTEVCILPTSLLSCHTAFDEFTFKDLSYEADDIVSLWRRQGITFDGIYTGYLGTVKQIKQTVNLINDFKKENTLVLVDPAMADFGKLYTGFDLNYAKEMKSLCKLADIIVPNVTESASLLDMPLNKKYDEIQLKEMAKKLCQGETTKVVITSVEFGSDDIGVIAYDKTKDKYFSYYEHRIHKTLHGSGDLFASVLMGALMNNKDFEESVTLAVHFTAKCINSTIKNDSEMWYGVNFEDNIYYLSQKFND